MAAHRHDPALPATCRVALLALGLLLSAAFAINLIPLETLDTFQWYRLSRLLSNVLFGLGWVVFGAGLARHPGAEVSPSPAAETRLSVCSRDFRASTPAAPRAGGREAGWGRR